MATAEQKKIIQYLHEAHATERALIRVLQTQIAVAPRGSHRDGLEAHLKQTRSHAIRVRRRLAQLGDGTNIVGFGVGVAETVAGQVLALGKAPLDLLRGSNREEKVLKNAKDACASEALEIATYTAIQDVAKSVGDSPTARLAASIRTDEKRMLDRLLREIPRLTDAVLAAAAGDSYELSETGAADAARATTRKARSKARRTTASARRGARQARRVPGVARAEGQLKGAVAKEGDLPIPRYGRLTVAEVVEKLDGLSQVDLAKIDSYERRHENRSTVLGRIGSLRRREPLSGYDELDVGEVRSVLDRGDEKRAREIASYERAHKQRPSVLEAAERELSTA